MNEQNSTRAAGPDAMRAVLSTLESIRLKARAVLIAQRTFTMAAAVVAAVVVLGLLDYLLRFPMFLRAGHWCVGLAAVGVLSWRRLIPAARFAPSLTDIALRIERSSAGTPASLSGILATGVDFARAAEAGSQGAIAGLIERVQLDAAHRYAQFAATSRVFRLDGCWRAVALLALAAAPALAFYAAAPKFAHIGLLRTVAPWMQTSWPKRTAIALGDTPTAFPLGTALPVRAVLTATDRAAGQTSVMLYYRVIASGQTSPTRKTPMTAQAKRVNIGQMDEGELYERLLDPDAMTVPGLEEGTAVTVEYWFETGDDQTAVAQVQVVPPPAITTAKAMVTPPAYAAAMLRAKSSIAATTSHDWICGEWDATPAGPNRGLIGPVLAGSKVELELTLNKDIPGLEAKSSPQVVRGFLARVLPGSEDARGVSIITAGSTWRLAFEADASMRVVAMLRDEHGIGASDDAAFKLEVSQDRPPTAAIIEPPQDESVLATAVLPVTGEGRDDVAIATLSVVQQITRGASPSASASEGDGPASAAAAGDPTVIATSTDTSPGKGEQASTTITATAQLELSVLKLEPGDEVSLTAVAHDLLLAGAGEEGVRSPRRRLRIIGESELIEQVRAELAGLREAAKRAEAEQSKLSSQRDAAQSSAEAAQSQLNRQQSLGERIAPMEEVVKRLQSRASRNQLNDEALDGVLKDAAELTKEGAQNAGKAADALDRMAQQPAGERGSEASKQDAAALKTAQEQVEQSLAELANMLDRGQDDWAVRRSIEKLLTQQQQLAARTASGTQAMQGKSAQELTPEQKADLERLAAEQMDLSHKSQAMVNSVQERAAQMQKADAAQAQAMQSAANKARSEQLARKQEEAAANIAQNKTGEANRQQEEASKTLAKMLEELDRTQQRKDETLRRVLADVKQSLQKLIDQQQEQMTRLAAVIAGKEAGKLDAGMILLHQNTLGVATTVREQVKGGEHLLTLLSAAGEAQSGAITALRAVPADHPEADTNERVSMTRLKEALTEAERLDEAVEEREEDRKRAELRKAYIELLEGQVAIGGQAQPLIGKALDRRQRAVARALAEQQEVLRQKMEAIRSDSAEVAEAALFDFAHRRFDVAAAAASKKLGEGTTPAALGTNLETAAKILQGLVAALDEAQKKKDEFKEDEEEGGGNDGGGQGGEKKPAIPPIAELKLLRAMQAEAAERTRLFGQGEQDAAADELTEISSLQRELAKFAGELLEKIKQENEGGGAPTKERN